MSMDKTKAILTATTIGLAGMVVGFSIKSLTNKDENFELETMRIELARMDKEIKDLASINNSEKEVLNIEQKEKELTDLFNDVSNKSEDLKILLDNSKSELSEHLINSMSIFNKGVDEKCNEFRDLEKQMKETIRNEFSEVGKNLISDLKENLNENLKEKKED